MPRKKKEKDRENDKDRNFMLLLYPDNPAHKDVIDLLSSPNGEYMAVGCCHNMDVYESGEHKGEFKKPHFHFIVKFKNPRYISGVSIEFAIDERFIQFLDNWKNAARYLLHWGDPDKYQYDPSDLVGTLKSEVLKLIDDTSDDTKLQEITRYLNNTPGVISFANVWDYVLKQGYANVYRRYYTVFSDLIGQHNADYYRRMERRQ